MQVYDECYIKASYDNVVQATIKYFAAHKPAYSMQMMQSISFDDACEQQIYRLLIIYLLKAEVISPGGCEGFISALATNDVKYNDITSLAFNKHFLKKMLASFVDAKSIDQLVECFDIAGLRGKIVLSPHAAINNDVVEVNFGCFFSELMPAFKIKSTKFLNSKIICIDGFIENVSEIHRVLDDALKQKETIILFARGLSEEVIHTLKVNYDRGTLQVIPIIVKYDLDNANILNDLAVTSCSDVVSSLKGQLISNIDISTFSRVDSVVVTPSGILVENDIATNNIDFHIKNLQNKINTSENQYEKDVLTKRIQNLGVNRITVHFKNDQLKKTKSLEFDRAIRSIKSATSYGICELRGAIYPYIGVAAGAFFAKKFNNVIVDLGALIV